MVDVSMQETASEKHKLNGRIIADEDEITNKHIRELLVENKRDGLVLAVKARFLALTAVSILAVFMVRDWSVLYYLFLLGLFMLNGWAQLQVGRLGRSRKEVLLIIADLVLMAITVGVPNPFSNEAWSAALQYKWSNFPYFYIILATATMAYSWRTLSLVAWFTTFLWGLVLLYTYFQPVLLPEINDQIGVLLTDYPNIWSQVDFAGLEMPSRIQDVVLFVIVTGILMLNSWRSNRLLEQQARVVRERSNLARYFAPSLVEHLAERDDPLGEVRAQPVVVMFVDIVGFTKMAEQDAPDKVVTFLREFHSRMETAVFDHQGTLDKFLGDGLMITFGTPNISPDDAINAVECAVAMQTSILEWNAVRAGMGLNPVLLSIGLHYGEVILGDIGSERRLEFAVLGDVVNVSSRLEALTRTVGAAVVASDAVIQAAGKASSETAGFQHLGAQAIRGREEPVDVWVIPRAS